MYALLVQDLIDSGMSEKDIAQRVGSSQPTIHRIKRGHIRFDVGVADRLRALHAERLKRSEEYLSAAS